MTVQVRPRLHAPEAQSVAFVELFFDLVFVFAVTQVTALTAHNLTPDGVLRSLVLFWLIWWAWTQFTWTLNPADTTHVVVRVITLAATAAAFVMATTVSQAFLDDGVWFALPYLVVRILGLTLQVLVEMERTNDPRAAGIWRWAGTSAIGLALVLVGALADPSIRPLIWVLAILTDLLATQAASGRTWDIHVGHMAERHALFVIIAIGESLIVAGTAVAAHERTLRPGRRFRAGPPDCLPPVVDLLRVVQGGTRGAARGLGAERTSGSGFATRTASGISRCCSGSSGSRWASRRSWPIQATRSRARCSSRWAPALRYSSASRRSSTGGFRARS